jgi:hypothetical protein
VGRISNLLAQARVKNLNELKDIPVEAIFDGTTLESWRILTEVI